MQLFHRILDDFMARAGVERKELAARVHVDPSTVSRWLSKDDPTRPRRRKLRQIREALSLSERDYVLLCQAAYPDSSQEDTSVSVRVPADVPIKAAGGTLYLYRHSPADFPSRWSMVNASYEVSTPGMLYTLFSTLPAPVRLPEFYEQYAQERKYDPAKVESYTDVVRRRSQAFHDRAKDHVVRHIYHRRSIVELIASNRWRQVTIPSELWDAQLAEVSRLLDTLPNFSIGLSLTPIPFHVTVIGHRVALVEMLHHEHFTPISTVFGFETNKPEVVLAMEEQFDSLWGSDNVETNRERVRAWFDGGWKDDARTFRDELDAAIQARD